MRKPAAVPDVSKPKRRLWRSPATVHGLVFDILWRRIVWLKPGGPDPEFASRSNAIRVND
jgi:hypothetical protein